MPKAYSQDLRDRMIDAVERDGMCCRAAARSYEISGVGGREPPLRRSSWHLI